MMVATLNFRLDAYGKLSDEDRAALDRLAGAFIRTVSARRDLVREGDSPRAVFLLIEGWGCRYKALPDGRRQIVDFLVPGDLCDCHSLVLRGMDHSVGAITGMKVAEIAAEELERLMQARPAIARRCDGTSSSASPCSASGR